MIETKEFTFAESKEEAVWIEEKAMAEKRIKDFKKNLMINEAYLEMCNSKIKLQEKKK